MKNRYVLICGGTGGLGRAVTRKALAQGARVLVAYHSENQIDSLHEYLSPEYFRKIELFKADLTAEEEVERLMSGLPGLEVLIQLVGGFAMGATADFTLQNWKRQLDLNLTTTFLCCKHGLRRMRTNNYGRIVTVGSRAAAEPAAQMAAYSAAKAAVVALTRSIAAETRGTGITANIILPGIIDTPANRQAMGADGTAAVWVSAESIAELICFLAAETAGTIRGAVIPIYGHM
jgi:NAD(P)-dependent dehydrogenase (short-subunit alcohol dehydrogenase family)